MNHGKAKSRNVRRRGCHSWSKLPGKIILKISEKIETRQDILHFKQVCAKWRKRSLAHPKNLLSYNIPLPFTIKNNSSNLFPFHKSKGNVVLRSSNIYLLRPIQHESNDQSRKPWVIMAEELNSGKVKLRHPLTAKRVKDFQPVLDMTRFEALELAQGYNFKSSNCVQKVLLCSSSATSLQVLVLYYKGVLGKLSLDVLGSETGVDDEDKVPYAWKDFKVRCGKYCFLYLDDVEMFRGMACGVDRKGRLYELDTEGMTIAKTTVLVSKPICRGVIESTRRKRLVVDKTSGELHLVVREKVHGAQNVRFKVYKFNEEGKKWDLVMNIGNERVLFVGVEHCFFAMAKDFPGCDGNSIVFASFCFTQYCGRNAPDENLFLDEGVDVGVYRMGGGDNFTLLSSAFPEFSGVIWPTPTWFSTMKAKAKGHTSRKYSCEVGGFLRLPNDHTEGLLSASSSDDIESSSESSDEDMDSDDVVIPSDSINIHDIDEDADADADAGVESDSSGPTDSDANVSVQTGKKHSDAQEQTPEKHSGEQKQPVNENFVLPVRGVEDGILRSVKRVDQEQPVNENDVPPAPAPAFENSNVASVRKVDQTSEEDFTEPRVLNANETPVTSSFSSAGKNSGTVMFAGAEIRSEILPTLKTIWAKHGNLIGENTVHGKMLAGALDDLAELKITLDSTPARALTKSQTDHMRSTLSDIKRAGLKVDWLEPYIEKATEVQKSRELLESISAIKKKKEKIDQEKREFLARTAKMKKELEESEELLYTRIPFSKDNIIDLDDCLGAGI